MKYFVIDNSEVIKVIDRDSLKERRDIEYIHDLTHITDIEPDDDSCFEIETEHVLVNGSIYYVVNVEYDVKNETENSFNVLSLVGIYDEITANKIVSGIKDNLRKHPDDDDPFEIDDESINPVEWKIENSIVKKIISVPLKFKQGDR